MKLGISSVVWITVATILISRTLGKKCNDQTVGPNCADCPNPPICAACEQYGNPDGTYGFYVDKPGCGDCFAASNGSCSSCKHMSKCDQCTDSWLGPKMSTTTAECAECSTHCLCCKTRGAGKCDNHACKPGYTLDYDSKICIRCTTANCVECYDDNAAECRICADNFKKDSSGRCISEQLNWLSLWT